MPIKQRNLSRLAIAPETDSSHSVKILTTDNFLTPQDDPKLDSIEAYEKYYNDKMKQLAENRKKHVEESSANKCFQENMHLNRYNNVIPMTHTQPTQHYFNGNIIWLGDFQMLVTQAPIDLDQYYDTVFEFDTQMIV